MTGAEIVIKSLESLSVDTMFGYIGNYIMPVFDNLQHSNIKLITTASEVGATFAADGYSRSCEKVGVVLATSGPGATNLVTGIATAYMDSIPLVAITANVPRSKLGKDSFQEVDIAGIATPITKYAHIVSAISKLEYDIKNAFLISASGRKGPVLIDIPHDILLEEYEYQDIKLDSIAPQTVESTNIDLAIDVINKSKNVGILIGGGASCAIENIDCLASKLTAPIFATMRAVGLSSSQLFVGMVGMSAPKENNVLMQQCDVIIAVGTRFSDRTKANNPKQKFIHIDIDPSELGKVVDSTDICGDASTVLQNIMPYITAKNNIDKLEFAQKNTIKSKLAKLASIVSESIGDGTILATDVGTHQVAMLNAIAHKNHNEILSSAGLGTMGYGLGAAIGGAVATNKTCLLFTGDGSFNMAYNELITAVKLQLNIVIVIANNKSLRMIKDIQKRNYSKRYFAVETPYINYALLAKSMGANGINCSLKTANKHISTALKNGGVTIINVNLR